MQTLLEQFKECIRAFVEQSEDFLLLVRCTDNEAAIALKLLRDFDQENGSDVTLPFADDFVALEPYVAVAVERLREQRRLACDWLAEQNREPLPSPPATLSDHQRPPLRRLAEAMRYARSLLPSEGGHRLVWAMIPPRIADRASYRELVSAFSPQQGLRPAMQGLRLIFRDPTADAAPDSELAALPRVRIIRLDLSPAVLEQALVDEVEDEDQPEPRRMQSLLSLALLDSAHNRRTDAFAKFRVLLGYYQHTGDRQMQGFVMNAVGNVYQREGRLDRAQEWYECALEPAIESQDVRTFHGAVRNLADIAYQQGDYALAEQHFASAEQLSTRLLDSEAKAHDLEWRGLSQERQGAYERATGSWEDAATLCRAIGLVTPLKANLEHLARGYRHLGRLDRLAAVRAEIEQLPADQVH